MEGEDIARRFNGYLNIPFALTATIGNALVLGAIWRTPSLHRASNVFVFCLGMTDLGVGLIGQPLWIIRELSPNENDFLRKMFFTAKTLFLGLSMLTVTLIGIDRYLAVKLHLRYQGLITLQRTVCVVVIMWVATLCFAITVQGLGPTGEAWDSFRFTVFPTMALCFFINIFVYLKLYHICRFHHVKIQDQAVLQQDSSMYQRAVNEARFRKSVKTMFFIVLAFILCYFPALCFSAASLVLSYQEITKSPIMSTMLNFATTILFANSSVNPALLIFQLTELRFAIKRILKNLWSPARKLENRQLKQQSKIKFSQKHAFATTNNSTAWKKLLTSQNVHKRTLRKRESE